jgi:hypothetical protein
VRLPDCTVSFVGVGSLEGVDTLFSLAVAVYRQPYTQNRQAALADSLSIPPSPSLMVQAAARHHYKKDGKTGNYWGERLLYKRLGSAAVELLGADAFQAELKAETAARHKKLADGVSSTNVAYVCRSTPSPLLTIAAAQ